MLQRWKSLVEIMDQNNIILIGAGEHARVVLDSLRDSGKKVVAFIDPKHKGNRFMDVDVYEDLHSAHFPGAHIIVAIGNNALRKKIASATADAFATSIHPSALISAFATVGKGSMILHGSIVQQSARIGAHVILNTGGQVDHDCIIGDYAHIAPRTVLCGRVEVGEGALIGAGSTLIPGVKIGAWATIGAGAVVINDIPDFAVAVGNPARILKNPKHG
jgi:sugar O-acyltransferase (sialic acid O-acetyltransferase NeuD family)